MVQLSLCKHHSGCEISCQGVPNQSASLPILRRDQPNGRESCIILESRPTCSFVSKPPQDSSLAVHEF